MGFSFSFQATNASLTDRLQEAEDELDNHMENSLDKAEVLQRLEDLTEDIDHGRDQVRQQSGVDEDLGKGLEELQQRCVNLINALKKKKERGDWDKKTVRNNLISLATSPVLWFIMLLLWVFGRLFGGNSMVATFLRFLVIPVLVNRQKLTSKLYAPSFKTQRMLWQRPGTRPRRCTDFDHLLLKGLLTHNS